MAQALKNYYKILDIEAFSDTESVKSAFRKLARQYHPDLNPGDLTVEEKFKAINEAYEILGTPEKKAFYDESLRVVLKNPQQQQPGAGQAAYKEVNKNQQAKPQQQAPPPKKPEPPPKASSTPINELFETFIKKGFHNTNTEKNDSQSAGFGAKNKTKAAEKSVRGQDVTVETLISPMEAQEGVVKTVNVQHNELCRRCSGTGKVSGKVCTACHGEKIMTRLKKIDVRIPAGVKTGSKVRVAAEGGRGEAGGEHGDLFLQIQIQVDASLRIEGLDVYGDLEVTVVDAVLGADIQVPTLNGKVKMTIPPLTSSGKVFRLKEQGVSNGATKGDHFVTVRLVAPEQLSQREKELYQELAKLQNKGQ